MALLALCITLLVASVSGHPQYNPNQQQVGSHVIPTHSSDGSVLTEEQRDKLQQFWSQVEQAFGDKTNPGVSAS